MSSTALHAQGYNAMQCYNSTRVSTIMYLTTKLKLFKPKSIFMDGQELTVQYTASHKAFECCWEQEMHAELIASRLFTFAMKTTMPNVRWPRRAMSITNFNISNYQF